MSNNDLTFVVQLNSGPTAGKDKALINAHISRRTHSQRRKRAQQESLDSQQVPTIDALVPLDRTLTADRATNFPPRTLSHGRIPRSISPLTAIGDGDADWINALQFRIDLKAHRYLSFGRDALEIAIHGPGWRGWVGGSFQRKQYAGPDLIAGNNILAVKDQLEHPAWFMVVVYGVLAYCASGLATITTDPDAKRDALRYATEGMKCMRKHLDDVQRDVDRISEELVYRLFRAEVIAGNHASALIHGQLLKIVLEHRSKGSGLRLDILSNALFQNGHWMFGSWTRSIFDSGWVAEQYQSVWNGVDEMFENDINFEERDLNASIQNMHLRKLCFLTKRLFLQSRIGICQQREAPLEQHYSLATKCEWLQIMWMEYYLNHEGSKFEADDVTALEHDIDMCLVLSSLYVLRHAKNDPVVNGQPLFRGSLQISQKLSARLSELYPSINSCIPESRTDTLTYVFYVNAVAAAYVRCALGVEDKACLCYVALKQHLLLVNIENWSDLHALLATFPFVEDELPQPYPGWCEGLFEEELMLHVAFQEGIPVE